MNPGGSIELWGRASSTNVRKVLWLARELGLDIERHEVGGAAGGLDEPGFAALNPHRRIPVLRHGDLVVWESHAILRYVAATFGDLQEAPPYGDTAARRAPVDAWLDWGANVLWPPVRTRFQHAAGMAQASSAALAAADVQVQAALDGLAAALEHRSHLARDTFSIADIAAATFIERHVQCDPGNALPPAVRRWLDTVCARPAYLAPNAPEPAR